VEAVDASVCPKINDYQFILQLLIQTQGLSIEPLMVGREILDLQFTLFFHDILVHKF
jgi:hypothetical protein